MVKNRCSHEGCTHGAKKGGVCSHTHHVLVFKHCSQEGCTNQAILGGVCVTHGAMKRCSHAWCIKQARKRGLCRQHYRIRYEATTTDVGGVLGAAAPQPARSPPRPPSFAVGPPESVTVSIIIDNEFRQCFPTSFSSFSNSQDQNEDDVINKEKAEDDDEEDERVGAWIYKTSRTSKLFAMNVLSSSSSSSLSQSEEP
jgi:hypothetical protein